MMPFRPVKYSWFDLALGVVGLCGSTAMSIVTLVRCRNTWQLLVIAVWKLSMSLLNGITSIHVALLFRKASRKERPEGAAVEVPMDDLGTEREEQAARLTSLGPEKRGPQPSDSAVWILLCKAFYDPTSYHNCLQVEFILDLPGMIAGMSGLMNLVMHSEGHRGVLKITAAFCIIVGIGLIPFIRGVFEAENEDITDFWERCGQLIVGLGWMFVTFTILSVFYSDWVLGMMTTNLVGLPTGDSSVFYWTYFISKRLPMFSW